MKVRGKKCIQFTDDRDGIKYALKVIKGTSVAFEVSESARNEFKKEYKIVRCLFCILRGWCVTFPWSRYTSIHHTCMFEFTFMKCFDCIISDIMQFKSLLAYFFITTNLNSNCIKLNNPLHFFLLFL